jgi:hypothetical protein
MYGLLTAFYCKPPRWQWTQAWTQKLNPYGGLNKKGLISYPIYQAILTYSMQQSPSWEANRLQLVKKFLRFYGTRRSITAFTSVRHLSLSWARSIQSIPSHPNSWRAILMLSSHLQLYQAILHLYITLWCSKVIPDCAMEAHGENEAQLHLFLSSALNINGQLHSPAALSPVKVSPSHIEYIPKPVQILRRKISCPVPGIELHSFLVQSEF